MQVITDLKGETPGSLLFFLYRSGENSEYRDHILDKFDEVWEEQLRTNGVDESEMFDLIGVDIMPLPGTEKRAV